MATLALVLLCATGLQVVVPLILQQFIDSALSASPLSVLTSAGVAYLVVGVFQQVLSATSTYLGADVGWRATNQLRLDLARHALGLDMGFHNSTTPGEMIERIDGDVTAVSNFISRFVVRLLGSGLLLVAVVIVSMIEDWRLGVQWWSTWPAYSCSSYECGTWPNAPPRRSGTPRHGCTGSSRSGSTGWTTSAPTAQGSTRCTSSSM
ncbi:MAG: ABC transporter ATP-binding protein [Acidimicrobiia bacterium]